jgi:hypothetical protein
MSLVEIKWHPNRKELRDFGKIALIASAILCLLLYVFKGIGIKWSAVILALGIAIFLISLFSIKLTKLIYLGLILITFPIGWAISFILMAIFYFLLITPLGLVFRLMGKDLLNQKFDSNAKSYWVVRKPPENIDRYFHQF